jgi:hypothetical protein
MKPKKFLIATLLVLLMLPTVVVAQPALEADPGYFPLEDMNLLDRDELSLEINLQGAMLGMISAFLGEDDPELSALVSGLRGLRVRGAELSAERFEAVRRGVGEAAAWLDGNGWQPIVRVREDGEEVYIYMKGVGDAMDGLTVLALESGEVTIVNLIGAIDMAKLSVLVEGFGLPDSAGSAGVPSEEDEGR